MLFTVILSLSLFEFFFFFGMIESIFDLLLADGKKWNPIKQLSLLIEFAATA